MLFFRLHESPRYLVHAGRPQEAIESLQMISKFNGSELSLDLEDVYDHRGTITNGEPSTAPQIRRSSPPRADVVFDADAPSTSPVPSRTLTAQASHEVLRGPPETRPSDYSSTGAPNVNLSDHTFQTPQIPHDHDREYPSDSTAVASPSTPAPLLPPSNDNNNDEEDYFKAGRQARHSRLGSSFSRRSTSSRRASRISLEEVKGSRAWRVLPRFVRRPLAAWVDRVGMVLTPEWLRTTVLVWVVWCAMSLGVCLSLDLVCFD